MRDQATALRNLKEQTAEWAGRPGPSSPAAAVAKTSTSIVVTSGKGGVGKTQFSVSLAIALARFRKKVVLFDADLGLANIDLVLGLHPEWHLIHVLEGRCRLADIVIPGPEGIRILPASSGVERLANLDSAQLQNLGLQLAQMETTTDVLVIDTGAGIARSVMHFAAAADRVAVITTPEPAAFADAYAAIKCILRNNPNAQIGLVVNQCRTPDDGRSTFERMRLMVVQFLRKNISFHGELPYERGFMKTVRQQRAILMEDPQCGYAKGIMIIARKLAGIAMPEKMQRPGYFSRFFYFLSRLED